MRFSLKWILAATLYVAIAAAAFSQQSFWYADALWLISAIASITAAMRAIYLRGRQKAAAIGFLVGAACLLACLQFSPNAVPTRRLLSASRIIEDNNSVFLSPGSALLPAERAFSEPDLQRLRGANAVGTLAFGFMGSLVGLMAFRAASVEPNRRKPE